MATTFPVPLSGASKVQLWADESTIEAAALEQLRAADAHPDVVAARVMPDVHYGKGFTVGSVIAMRDAVAPAAVGVDIGCGVSAVKTSLRESDLEGLPALRSAIERVIPVGFNARENMAALATSRAGLLLMQSFNNLTVYDTVADRESKVAHQLGTLGGGNHFIELCADEDGDIWLTLHSGSRNIGKEIAERHIAKAKGLEHNAAFGDMAVFRGSDDDMARYLHDLNWAQSYAAASRELMMALLRGVVTAHFEATGYGVVMFGAEINVHHNYVAEETIDGETLVVTRKGAIAARKGEYALIPGSMGTGSYIVKGLGNPASLFSASHGAGRTMSRNKAKKLYTAADLATQTEGIECRKDAGVVDEIPSAYKDLHNVIDAQSDLVEPVAHLRTLLCVKG